MKNGTHRESSGAGYCHAALSRVTGESSVIPSLSKTVTRWNRNRDLQILISMRDPAHDVLHGRTRVSSRNFRSVLTVRSLQCVVGLLVLGDVPLHRQNVQFSCSIFSSSRYNTTAVQYL